MIPESLKTLLMDDWDFIIKQKQVSYSYLGNVCVTITMTLHACTLWPESREVIFFRVCVPMCASFSA